MSFLNEMFGSIGCVFSSLDCNKPNTRGYSIRLRVIFMCHTYVFDKLRGISGIMTNNTSRLS